MLGRKLAHYEITAKIGEGGMGEVYRARDGKLDRDVALKVLSPQFSKDPERLARFEREAKTLASLQHPNIASIYGFEEADGQPVLVMELVEGEDLAQRLARGALPLDEAREIARQIARGLEEAHDRGIVHRDLKPANVKLTPDGKVKILDFGLARALIDEPSDQGLQHSPTITAAMTQGGVILGTAAYMSPEQARGHVVDRRADIWAFGCVLFEMLAGRAPFGGGTITDLLAEIVKTEPDWQALPDDTPASLRTLLWRCLQKDARNRLRDIGDARLELSDTDLRASGVLPAVEVPAGAAAPSTTASRTWLWPVVGAALAGLAIGFFASRVPSDPPHEPVVSRLAIRSIEYRPFSLRIWPSLAISRDGRSIYYSASAVDTTYTGSTVQLGVRRLDSDRTVTLQGTDSGVSPFLSPDGQWIGYFEYTTQLLKRVPVAGGQTSEICESTNGFAGAYWAADGAIYFTTSNGGGLYRVTATGGEPELLLAVDEPEEVMFHRPTVVDDPAVALFTVSYLDSQRPNMLVRLDLVSGQRQELFPADSLVAPLPSGAWVYLQGDKLMARRIELQGNPTTATGVTLAEGVGPNVALAANGTLIYVGSDAGDVWSGRVVLVDERGLVKDALDEPLEYARYPRVSPDGTKLAITVGPGGNGTLWVHDLRKISPPVNLTFDGHNTFPVWSPDGKQIAFSRAASGSTRGTLAIIPADGSALQPRLLESGNQYGVLPGSWSATGRVVAAYTNTKGGGADVWEIPVDAPSESRPILQTQFDEGNTCMLSPDGQWLTYTSNRSGRQEIWVQRYPDGPPSPVTSGGATEPVWSRDGRRLFYQSGNAIMVVDVDGSGPRMSFSKPRPVYEGAFLTHQALTPRTYDVLPDGSLLLIQRIDQDDWRTDIVVVQNWFEEIRDLIP